MSYASVADMRAEGVPGSSSADIKDSVVQAKLDLWSAFIDRACKQWFEPRTLTLNLNGNDSRVLFLPVPIIEVTALYMNGDFDNAVDPANYKVYNGRTYAQDDRRNPKIELASMDLGIYAAPLQWWGEFVIGTQNQRIVGEFGYTEEDDTTPELIKRAVLKLAIRDLKNGSTTGGLWDASSATVPGGPIQSETTDGHSITYGTSGSSKSGLHGITGDTEVDRIIDMYRGPILIASTKGAGGPDRRWR